MKRARGRPGARGTRDLMCIHALKKMRHMSIQVQRKHSGLPRAMVLRLIRALPGDLDLLVTIPRVMRSIIAKLTPTLGRQDHTLSPYALMPLVCDTTRPPQPAPRFVTIAKRPSWWDRMTGILRATPAQSRIISVKSNIYSGNW